MELQFRITGALLVALSALHLVFPRYFNWSTELKSLSLVNRQMMSVHTFFIALTVFLMGILCISSPMELTNTPLGKKISLGLGIFWLIRLVTQFFGYSSALWRGKKFETRVHILFTLLWVYLSMVFIAAFIL